MLFVGSESNRNKKPVESTLPINIDELVFDLQQPIPEQQIVLTVNEKIVGSLGSMVVLTGKPKARKSTFLHFILASAITHRSYYGIQCKLPDAKKTIVLIDTEQSNFELYNSIGRLSKLTGIPIHELNNYNFIVYSARKLDASEIRLMVNEILQKIPNIGILAIDGAIDLINDINDVKESKNIIQNIKFWIDTYSILFITIIHQNKSTNFSLGHLGSFASRFAQSELSIEKNDDGSSTMKSVYLRSDDNFADIEIEWDETNKIYIEKHKNSIDWITVEHESIINKIFANKDIYKYNELVPILAKQYLKSEYFVKNHIVPFLFDNKLIAKHKTGIVKFR